MEEVRPSVSVDLTDLLCGSISHICQQAIGPLLLIRKLDQPCSEVMRLLLLVFPLDLNICIQRDGRTLW